MPSAPPPRSTVSLPIIDAAPPDRSPRSHIGPIALRLYRLLVVTAIVLIIHRHHARLRVDGDAPIQLDEAKPFFPQAARLETDNSERRGLFVLDNAGKQLGYLLRTSPLSDSIKGYSGPTDTLIALDPQMRVMGIRIRSSWDTKQHVRDVDADEYFMKTWNGKTWDQVAGMEPHAAGIEGVSGASLTSMAIATGIQHRFKQSLTAAALPPPPVHVGPHDVALIFIIGVATAFTFSHRLRSRTPFRRAFQVILIGYVGFWNGQMLAQSLMSGWAAHGVGWRVAPAAALLLAAALIVPWTSRRALYCAQICPHGAAQELLGRLRHRKLILPRGLDAGLRYLPAMLIALVLTVTVFNLPIELAGVEPFDAYLIRAAGLATITIAVVGLVAAVFVPMAYCKYGCPTGLVLAFVRSHGRADRFTRRDLGAGLMVLFVIALYAVYPPVHHWIVR